MAKWLKGVAVAAAVMWAGSAQAVVKLAFTGDLATQWYGPGPPGDPEIIVDEQGTQKFYLEAENWDADRFYLHGTGFVGQTCSFIQEYMGCLTPTFSGNTLRFDAPEAAYGYFKIDLTFDRDIEGDPLQINPLTFVGGSFDYVTAHGGYSLSIRGPVVLTSVPEPATWAMMLAGLGLIGGAMRKVRPAAIPAR